MQWTEIAVVTNHAGADFVAELLVGELGAKGVVVDDAALLNRYIDANIWDYTSLTKSSDEDTVTVTAYLPQGDETKAKIAHLQKRLAAAEIDGANLTDAKVLCRTIADEDWSQAWKQYFRVTPVGEKLVIKPAWENYTPTDGQIVLEVDPGMAFGTGTHPTTALCLREIERLNLDGKTVFDIGTGSGILATAAAKLGAQKIIAADNDETALKVARENAAQNKVADKITFVASDLFFAVEGKADVIIANIVADIILRLLPDVKSHLNADGILLVGGIIDDREEEIRQAATQQGLSFSKMTAEKEWRAMVFVA